LKIICFYLPQFHETARNNEWWGKGYTDWNAAKNAKPLFKGHIQPKKPMNDNYYDLSDETAETIKWQSELAKEHGIYGFCIYHYWFSGEKMLERPAEILLCHKEIDIHYTFCWDSSTWRRTWYADAAEQEILIEQKFGDEAVWQQHFLDLLPFFQDERYIKIDNKPVFHIYKASTIPCLQEMKACWDDMARKNGFEGIYLISGDIVERRGGNGAIDAFYNYEPNRAFYDYRNSFFVKSAVIRAGILKRINRIFGTKFFPDKRSARMAYQKIARHDRDINDKKIYYGLFTNYDDTPRRQMRGAVYANNKLEYFEKCLEVQIRESERAGNEFLYINAWNEWGEGACMEPDADHGTAYLECVKRVQNKGK
jgi:hypothetical protein